LQFTDVNGRQRVDSISHSLRGVTWCRHRSGSATSLHTCRVHLEKRLYTPARGLGVVVGLMTECSPMRPSAGGPSLHTPAAAGRAQRPRQTHMHAPTRQRPADDVPASSTRASNRATPATSPPVDLAPCDVCVAHERRVRAQLCGKVNHAAVGPAAEAATAAGPHTSNSRRQQLEHSALSQERNGTGHRHSITRHAQARTHTQPARPSTAHASASAAPT
jgi:hypothetical protein